MSFSQMLEKEPVSGPDILVLKLIQKTMEITNIHIYANKKVFFGGSTANKDYMLQVDEITKLPVYCNMDGAGLGDCGGGGWTLVMKINGTKVV